LRSTPQRYPDKPPSVRTTRWHGMAIASGLAAQAGATGRSARKRASLCLVEASLVEREADLERLRCELVRDASHDPGADATHNDCSQMAPEVADNAENGPAEIQALEEIASVSNPGRMPHCVNGETNAESVVKASIGGSLHPDLSTPGAPDDRVAGWPPFASQNPEIIQSAPVSGARPRSPAGRDAVPGLCTAHCGEAPPQDASGPETASVPYAAPDPYELAPIIAVKTPTETPCVFRLVEMRMVRNGMMACG
jgi:hypothetical protein